MRKHGFTLIELMIVVAIVAIIAAIAIPNLLRSRMQSNEAAAIGSLRAVLGAQQAFKAANGKYAATLEELTTATPPILDGNQVAPKRGYKFSLTTIGDNFAATAEPVVEGTTGNRYFYVDQSGIIRQNVANPAKADSKPV